MPSDPLGPDSPFGDNAEIPESAAAEDFLGLGGPSTETDLDALASGPGLDQPTPEETQPMDADEAGEPTELSLVAEPDPLAEFADEEQDFDFGDALTEEEDDSASWLMEFDLADGDEDQEAAFADALQEGDEEQLVEAGGSTRNPWLARALIAVISVAGGVVGSKFIAGTGNPAENPVRPRVAQVDSTKTAPVVAQPNITDSAPVEPSLAENDTAATGASETANKPRALATGRDGNPKPIQKGGASSATTTPDEFPVAGGNPSPTPEIQPSNSQPTVSGGPSNPAPGEPAIAVDWQSPDPGRERRTQEVPVEDMVSLPAELDSGLRKASPAELANIWMGKTIPVEAIAGTRRILTPSVGRVRVVLASGEIFEGKLYAVGARKVWIETELGKMALLDYQIDRVEHILGADGGSLAGGDASRDLAGLQGVRVRTAGGVFYGKLLSQEGATVTIVTDSGARITLKDARVELAGKTATQLVDSSGATKKEDGNDTPE